MLHKNNTFPYLDTTNTTSSPLISPIIPLRYISYLNGISHTSSDTIRDHQRPSEYLNSYLYGTIHTSIPSDYLYVNRCIY